jgi:porin
MFVGLAIVAAGGAYALLMPGGDDLSPPAAQASSEEVHHTIRTDIRFTPTERPGEPLPQHPPEATTENSDVPIPAPAPAATQPTPPPAAEQPVTPEQPATQDSTPAIPATVPAATEPAPTTEISQPEPATQPISQPAPQPIEPVVPATAPAMAPPETQPTTAPTTETSQVTEPATQPAEAASQPTSQPSTEASGDTPTTETSFWDWQRLTDDWFGIRPKLDDAGIAFDGSLALYYGSNFSGGSSAEGGGGGSLLNFNVTLDSQKLMNYEGGTLFINFRNQNGLAHKLDGSFGNESHLYAPDRTEVSEVWYEQKLLDDKLRVKFGKIDANTEFDILDNGGEFLNDFGSASPTVLAFPTDPDPAFGANVFVYPNDHFYAGFGIYDGSLLTGHLTGTLGPDEFLGGPVSVFMIGEIGAKWTGGDSGRAGRLGLGVWHHTGQIARFDGGDDNGATGPYVTFDQVLYRKNPSSDDDQRGLAMFMLAGYADKQISPVVYQIGGGMKWTGPLESRADDIAGLGVSYIRFSDVPAAGFDEAGETTFETFYKMRLNTWLSVQPDLQYVIHPGGISIQHNSLAGVVQVLMDF